MTNAPLALRAAAKRQYALRGGGRACPCCSDYGSTKTGPANRARTKRQQRRIEARQWRAEID